MVELKIEKVWAMPNHNTFEILPIKKLLVEEMQIGGLWLDAFARNSKLCQINNDLDPETSARNHFDGLQFLMKIKSNCLNGVLHDPIYSQRQQAEMYAKVGTHLKVTNNGYWSDMKKEISRITKPGAKVISFGWNSAGIGKKYGFEQYRILLVAHGSMHNDTIVSCEIKMEQIII